MKNFVVNGNIEEQLLLVKMLDSRQLIISPGLIEKLALSSLSLTLNVEP